jgi:hypothetical protein
MKPMGKWFAAVAVVVLATGCNFGASAFHCDTDHTCGAGGTCEANGLCSFPDDSCGSGGQRYGDLSGDLSGKCVGGNQPPVDAAIDALIVPPVDALVCYGSGIVKICFASAPTQPLTIANPTMIDTANPAMCATTVSGGSNYCVLVATTITINAKLRATGTKPLVLIANDTITTGAQIDVGSHRGANPETGAGADSSTCAAGTNPITGGGGAGGSFTGLGGAGGNGAGAAIGGGIPGIIAAAITELRGGCPGQDGQAGAANDRGLHGHGGGAVFLIAGTKIDIGGGINAAGEGGTAGQKNTAGAGGGGSGGMIGFDAPMITITSLILANGGGGGEGSGTGNTPGTPGNDPTSISAATGGAGNSTSGGDGGDGSAGIAAGPGVAGNPGTGGGGGGGGGGAGLVKAPSTANLGSQVSPAATP